MKTKLVIFAVLLSSAFILCGAETQKNIVFIGDSIACGVGAKPKTMRFSTVAVKKLNEHAGKALYKEVNLAISGSTMTDQPWPVKNASGYPYHVRPTLKAKPDIVVIEHGVNDNAISRSAAEFGWYYRNFIREIRKGCPGCTIVCMTFCPGKYGNDRKAWHAEGNAVIQEIAAQEGTLLAHCDLALGKRLELFPDKIHPNNEGHAILAEALVKAIEQNQKKSADSFDFVVGYPGDYRVCGWYFNVSPEAVKDGNFVIFSNAGKNGWTYSTKAPVKVTSPLLHYLEETAFRLTDAKGKALPMKSTRSKYRKQMVWELPAAEQGTVKRLDEVKK